MFVDKMLIKPQPTHLGSYQIISKMRCTQFLINLSKKNMWKLEEWKGFLKKGDALRNELYTTLSQVSVSVFATTLPCETY